MKISLILWVCRVVAVLAMVTLAGCSTAIPTYTTVDGTRLRLEDPLDAGAAVALDLSLEMLCGEKRWIVEATMEVEPRRVALVGFTPVGTTLFSLTLIDGELGFSTLPGVDLPIPPRTLILLLHLACWPDRSLAPWLGTYAIDLEDNNGSRTLVRDGKTVVTVTWDAALTESGSRSEVLAETADHAPGSGRISAPPYELGVTIRRRESLVAPP